MTNTSPKLSTHHLPEAGVENPTRSSKTKAKKRRNLDFEYTPEGHESQEEPDVSVLDHTSTKRKLPLESLGSGSTPGGSSPPQKCKKTKINSQAGGNEEYSFIESTPDIQGSISQSIRSESPSGDTKLKKKTRNTGGNSDDEYDFVPQASDDEDNDSEFSIPKNEKSTVVFEYSGERAKRFTDVINIAPGIYSEQEKSLFLQLAMRGFQPLFPKYWKHDFPTLPDSLFAGTGGESKPLIQTSRSSTFYAIKSLVNLFALGGRVRDCTVLHKRPEVLIKQAIRNYIRWATYDANVEISPVPVHAIYTQSKGESTLEAIRKLNQRLNKLAARYNYALSDEGVSSDLPLLIGIIICGPIVAILTLDMNQPRSSSENIDGKFLSQFDLSERGQDVWNCLAIAIIVMQIRKTMLHLIYNGNGMFTHAANTTSKEDL